MALRSRRLKWTLACLVVGSLFFFLGIVSQSPDPKSSPPAATTTAESTSPNQLPKLYESSQEPEFRSQEKKSSQNSSGFSNTGTEQATPDSSSLWFFALGVLALLMGFFIDRKMSKSMRTQKQSLNRRNCDQS